MLMQSLSWKLGESEGVVAPPYKLMASAQLPLGTTLFASLEWLWIYTAVNSNCSLLQTIRDAGGMGRKKEAQ